MSGTARQHVVYLVEDDPSAREATLRFLRAAGHVVRAYASASEFLVAVDAHARGCLVLDLHLPDGSGLELQRTLKAKAESLPIVFLSGDAEIRESVTAMKSGAVDFLTKSMDGSVLLEAISVALARNEEEQTHQTRRRELRARYEQLTPREREVFAHLISGRLNKQISFDLGTAEATVKIHRHRVLTKMAAASIADLVRMSADLGIPAAHGSI